MKKYAYRWADGDFGAQTWTWVSTQTETHPCTVASPGLTKCAYLSTGYENQHDITVSLDEITFDFTPNSKETVAAGSVRLLFGNRTYIDRLGYLYSNIDPLTGSGEQSGTFDYNNGIAKITSWTAGATNSQVVVQSMLTYLDHTVSDITFRTPVRRFALGRCISSVWMLTGYRMTSPHLQMAGSIQIFLKAL